MPTLVIKNPDGSQQEQEVAEQLTIGRGDGNDLVLSEGGVSRKHARFFLEGEACLVEDAGSSNGTFVDGEKIEGPTKLSSKSTVHIGDYEIQLKVGSKALPKASKSFAKPSREPTSALGKAVKPSAPRSTRVVQAIKEPGAKSSALAKRGAPGRATGPQLRGLTGGVTGKNFALNGTMTVGRVAGVDIQIDDDSVSRRHAEIVVAGREISVKDLGSANGTTVNGAPISDDTILSPGDIVQFGVVELMFETGPTSGARAPIARSRPGADAAPSRRPGRSDPAESLSDSAPAPHELTLGFSTMDPKRKKMIYAGGGVLALLFVLVLVKAITAPPDDIDTGPKSLGGAPTKKLGKGQQVELDPAEEIEAALTECRTYSSIESGRVDWTRAEAACQKVLELEPIHEEGNALLKRISVLKVCEENLNTATEQMSIGQQEAALDSLSKITKSCESYLLRSLSVAKEPLADVKKRAGADCKLYASNSKWDLAYKRCEVYARLACQTMDPKDLYAPPLMKLKLDGPLNPKSDWRPTDPLYLNFLKARDKLKPGEPLWLCPELPAFRPPPPPPDPSKAAKEELAARYKEEPELGRALVLYYSGDFQGAPVPLMKLGEKIEKAKFHEVARALLLDINNAINFYENGTTEITNDRPEKAEVPFQKALAVDERLVLGEKAATMSPEEKKRQLEKKTSFIRRSIVESMSSTSLEKGRALADRKDFRAACRVWKLGSTFSRSNIDLLKALTNVCTKKAAEAFDRAQTCEQLKAAQDFAVDGDGFKEKIVASMEEEGCR